VIEGVERGDEEWSRQGEQIGRQKSRETEAKEKTAVGFLGNEGRKIERKNLTVFDSL
jgi:hypothetical protein